MLKREWGTESNGKLPHLFIPSNPATLVPEFAVEDLPLDRTATFILAFAVKDLPLGRTLIMMMMMTNIMIGGPVTQAIRHSHPTTGVPSSHLGHFMRFSRWTKLSQGRFLARFLPFSLTTNPIPPYIYTHLIHLVSFNLPL